MKILNSVLQAVALGATLTLCAAGSAQAGGVYWSVGVAQPGLHVGVSSFPAVPVMPPVAMAPQPMPVYAPPVVVAQRPPVYYGGGYGYERRGWGDHERWERHEGWERREGWHHHEGRR